ncbi:MAG: hypothetical protein M5U28_21845 [Sandaracinaceae bacterium]|nr:hypothetical protein [Sandaracinaceae bacterium]
MYGCAREGEAMQMTRLAFGDLAAAVAEGRRMLESASGDPTTRSSSSTPASRSASARWTPSCSSCAPTSRRARARRWPCPTRRPPRGASSCTSSKLLEWQGCDDFDIDATFDAFWQGVDSHEQGAKIWNAAIDESF